MENENNIAPGMHKNFILENFVQDEQKILKRLSSEWYLTNSGKIITLATSRFKCFLMKPTKIFTEMFNLEREVLCIFSQYNSFEPRTLDAFEAASKYFANFRLESVCKVLISGDENVESKVNDLIKSDPEFSIVIPFSYLELKSNSDPFFLRNKFRKQFYARDLFDFRSPLKKDLYFFGRSDLIQQIINRHHSGEHTGLFGLRKSGKTSIIYAIIRLLDSNGEDYISIDCESPSIHKLRWNELLHYIVDEYRKKTNSSHKVRKIEEYTEKKATVHFENDLLSIYNSKKKRVLLILDEIERLSPATGASEHWRSQDDFIFFWQSLRAVYQQRPEIFTYMVVGTNPSCVERSTINNHDNPLFSSLPPQYVPIFDVTKVREMIRKLGKFMGIKFEENIYTKITDEFGGHPFLIRQFCSHLNSIVTADRPVNVDKALYEKAKTTFIDKSKEYIDMILDVLKQNYPDEYDMLTFLAQGDTDTFKQLARENNFFTNHLVGYGLVNHSEHGYSHNIEFLKEFLSERHKYQRNRLTMDEKLAEISSRRNNLERDLRRIIKNQLKSTFGIKSALDKVLSSLQEKRRDELKNKSLEDLLSKDRSDLYFNELKSIIDREWEAFKHILSNGEKPKYLYALDSINRCRNDAHAKEISDDDFSRLRLDFKLFEETLKEWI